MSDTQILPAPDKLELAERDLVTEEALRVFHIQYTESYVRYEKLKAVNRSKGSDYLNGWNIGANTLNNFVQDAPNDFLACYESTVGRLARQVRTHMIRQNVAPEYLEGLTDYYYRLAFGVPEVKFNDKWSAWADTLQYEEDETRDYPRT